MNDSNINLLKTGKHVTVLDGLRGFAVSYVLLYHFFPKTLSVKYQNDLFLAWDSFWLMGWSGVDLFFVLSGFLITGILYTSKTKANYFKSFYLRRVLRIFPIYYLLLSTYLIGYYFLKDVPYTQEALLKHPYPIWTYMTYIQSYFFGIYDNSGPLWIAPTWSVSVEEQFYFLTPFAIMFLGKKRTLYFIIIGIIIAPFIRYYLIKEVSLYAAYMFFPARMDSIFWGVLLAFVLRNEFLRQKLISYKNIIYLLILIIIFCLYFHIGTNYVFKFTMLAIMYTCIIWVILEADLKKIKSFFKLKFFTYTGLISYAIYMFHQPINCILHGVFFNSKPKIYNLETVSVTFISILIVYVLCHLSLKLFENPIRNIGLKFNYKD